MSEILKAKGNEAFAAKDYTKAASLYGDAITLKPTDAVLYSNKAMALIKLSQWPECIEICDKGLRNSPEKKVKLKLLWRRGIAYAKLNDFRNARESYQEALQNESQNSSVLKSIEELNAQESQFKRSHSVDEVKVEKKSKTEQKLKKIPIYEVDRLPEEFRDEKTPKYKAHLTNSTSVSEPAYPSPSPLSIPSSEITEKSTPKVIDVSKYPERPTIYQLFTIVKCEAEERPYAYNYLISLPVHHYETLFATGSIEPSLVNFLLDSTIFSIDKGQILADHVIALLSAICTAPRFSLIGMFCDKSKLQLIKQKLVLSGNQDEQLSSVLRRW